MSREELGKAIAEAQRKYKGIIFGNKSRMCEGFLKEYQEYIDDHIYLERLKKKQVQDIWCTLTNNVEENVVLIDIRPGEVMGSAVDHTSVKEKFQANFIDFIDH